MTPAQPKSCKFHQFIETSFTENLSPTHCFCREKVLNLEIKVDDSFPDGQFFLDGFGTPFLLDGNRNSRSSMLFIGNDIPAKVVSKDVRPTESFYVELNFQNKNGYLIVLTILSTAV